MKHIKNAKVTAKIQIREGAQIRVLGGTGTEQEKKEKNDLRRGRRRRGEEEILNTIEQQTKN